MDFILTIGGMALLLAGGEGLVRGAVGIANRAGISPFVIGLTIVGFGTSAPELVVSVDSVMSGAPGIAVGNVIGSNMANMMLVIGAVALLHPPTIERMALLREGSMLAIATVVFCLAAMGGYIDYRIGAAMLTLLIAYLGLSFWLDARSPGPATEMHLHGAEEFTPPYRPPLWTLIGFLLAGFAALVVGSNLTVEGATGLARQWGMAEEVIGLSIIAVGTSLPEIATSAVAALRRHSDVSLGNIIGSNIFNLLGIAGAATLAGPLTISATIRGFDIPILIGTTVIFMLFLATNRQFQRWEGTVMLLLYAIYIGTHFYG